MAKLHRLKLTQGLLPLCRMLDRCIVVLLGQSRLTADLQILSAGKAERDRSVSSKTKKDLLKSRPHAPLEMIQHHLYVGGVLVKVGQHDRTFLFFFKQKTAYELPK